ncbi:J domain-containing protein [Natrialbaceae archaeon AArc-T1-2]|uniref:J domain-containing protein n=1 Tax=Natrialbaceae archaeon AArc-T1-2 TaxID=3053904 RepID=UPI00255A8CEA|nr:J domain-containing protein [Natrialbaceae archaeon AArc-T1-2]WIV67962.1 J domain-containing protein [Natrialbaceae archaeon AArc-T1-2]
MTEDFYDLLDVPEDASQEEITAAFREQVRVYHPDLNDDDRAQAQFVALKKAYDVLDDPTERQAYDRLGHETYVAKRTSGLPSADVFGTDADADTDTDDEPSSETASTSTGDESSDRTERRGSSSSTDATSDDASATGAGASTSSSTAATSGTGPTAAGTATASTATSSATASRTAAASGTASSTHEPTGTSTEASTPPRDESNTDTAFVGWVRDPNVNAAWALIWASTLTYLAGLVHLVLENAAVLSTLGTELAAVGADPAGAWTVLTSGRHEIATPGGVLTELEPVVPSVTPVAGIGVAAGVVALSSALLAGTRIVRSRRGPVSTGEMAALAVVIGLTTVLVGGPLLAGAVLMPLLFGWTIHRTRKLPGWSPSYGYVLAVFAPAVAFAVGAAVPRSSPIAVDLLAFVVLPLAGAFGLSLRMAVRRRTGR